ncbi:UNVERIFIED_CONTAM: hypothetical protein K2H54_050040 [Gekko kuhli]
MPEEQLIVLLLFLVSVLGKAEPEKENDTLYSEEDPTNEMGPSETPKSAPVTCTQASVTSTAAVIQDVAQNAAWRALSARSPSVFQAAPGL